MRVTNSMLTNNSVINMQKTKQNYLDHLEQYNTQKKISRPSDDPIVAVRSLKYRTNMTEITQYLDKNIPDAFSWMDVTESALKQVNGILTNMYSYSTQAASDSYELEDRETIIDTLKQYKEFIYKQQLNSDYAGRYVFAGYRTDTQMIFTEPQSHQTYTITENLKAAEIDNAKYVYGGAVYAEGTSASEYANSAPELKECHRMTLSYKELDGANLDGEADYVTIKYKAADGSDKEVTAKTISIATKPQNTAYNTEVNGVGDSGVVFIPETGELIFGNTVYDEIRTTGDFSVVYNKSEFKENDVRPEHYFNCDVYDSGTGKTTNYTYPEGQDIDYQVNFSQTLKVNTLGCESIDLGIGRMIDTIVSASDDMDRSRKELEKIQKMIDETDIEAVDANGNNIVESLERLKSEIETEITLKNTILQETFGASLTEIKKYQSQINTSLSDLGARYKRLQLTNTKLEDLEVSYEELLSENEDIDIGEAYIKYTEADLLYQASLSATSKLLGNSLLDFI